MWLLKRFSIVSHFLWLKPLRRFKVGNNDGHCNTVSLLLFVCPAGDCLPSPFPKGISSPPSLSLSSIWQRNCLHLGTFTYSTRRNEFGCRRCRMHSHGKTENHSRGTKEVEQVGRQILATYPTFPLKREWKTNREKERRREALSIDLDIAADMGKKGRSSWVDDAAGGGLADGKREF